MREMIAAEHFGLTPALRAHVEENLSRVREVLPGDASLRIFLSEPAPGSFMVVCKAHLRHRDLVVREEGPDLYQAVEEARARLVRQIVEQKKRTIRAKRQHEHHGIDELRKLISS